MPTNKRFVYPFLVVLCASLFLMLFSTYSILLSLLLILLAFIKHKLFPITKELLWYVCISLGGALIEILLVNVSHAWQYETTHLFNIPMWMPLFWGVIGTSIVVLYDGFIKK